jgi:hypothetical protein
MKNINVEGIRDRYWIKKLIDPKDALVQKPKKNIQTFDESITLKINGYKQQDILKKRYDEKNFINFDFVKNLLKVSDFKCFYCQNMVLMMYDIKREMKQWSLDRKDNDLGHIQDNVIVSCLECNLQRRNKNIKSFTFFKQLNIQKEPKEESVGDNEMVNHAENDDNDKGDDNDKNDDNDDRKKIIFRKL